MKDKANEAGDEVAMGAARQRESASGRQGERLSVQRRRLLAGAAAALATPLLAHAAEGGLSAEGLPPLHASLRERLRQPRLGWDAAAARQPLAWRAQALARARALMLLPGEADTEASFSARSLGEQAVTGGLARRLVLEQGPGGPAPALLLLPAGNGPFPAVLLLHDHGARFDIGKEKLIRPWDDAERARSADAWVARYYGGRFLGEALLQRGYAVLAVDALGWGERSRPGFARDHQQALAANLLNLGQSWAALIASEDLRALRWLSAQPEIDAQRVAALGFSMGGFRAWQLAALSQQLAACVASHWMCTREGLMRPGGHTLQGQSAFAMLHPGLAAELDHPDVAALAAPRPLLMHAGADDPLFPLDAVSSALERLRAVWAAHGAAAQLDTRLWPGGHVFGLAQQQAALDWLDAQLLRQR